MFSSDTILETGKIAIISIVILLVAIPEGLPLATKLAMALCFDRLKGDGILITNLESI